MHISQRLDTKMFVKETVLTGFPKLWLLTIGCAPSKVHTFGIYPKKI